MLSRGRSGDYPMSDVYNSKLAKLLKRITGAGEYAITTGKSCCRYSCSEDFVSAAWRKHEETHKKQFVELGCFQFVIQYLWETVKHGYKNNKFEIEARHGER